MSLVVDTPPHFRRDLGRRDRHGFRLGRGVSPPRGLHPAVAIPINRIMILVIVAGVSGLVAAWEPARLNVPEAIGA
jgi:hypothetical protein